MSLFKKKNCIFHSAEYIAAFRRFSFLTGGEAVAAASIGAGVSSLLSFSPALSIKNKLSVFGSVLLDTGVVFKISARSRSSSSSNFGAGKLIGALFLFDLRSGCFSSLVLLSSNTSSSLVSCIDISSVLNVEFILIFVSFSLTYEASRLFTD